MSDLTVVMDGIELLICFELKYIYKTMMLRGIQGTYVYVCDEALRKYFREYMKSVD
jgi:DUF2075 family protein